MTPARQLRSLRALLFAAFLSSIAPAAFAGAFVKGVWDADAVPEAVVLFLQWGPRESKSGSPDRFLGQLAAAAQREVELVLREPGHAGGEGAVEFHLVAPVSFPGIGKSTTCPRCSAACSHPDVTLLSREYQKNRGCLFDVSFRPAGKLSQLEVADVRDEGESIPYLLSFEGAPRVRRSNARLVLPANPSLHSARLRVDGLEAAPLPASAVFDPAGKDTFTIGGELDIAMQRIPAGLCKRDGRMDLAITNDFFLARTEFTQGQWKLLTGAKPPHGQLPESADCPVQGITADDARLVCLTLDVLYPVRGYRWTVPTRAQFEYASRAGETADAPAADLDSIAWHAGNSAVRVGGGASPKRMAHPVAGKAPNAFGLYDTIGNVSELCQGDGKREEYSSAGSGYWTKPEDCHFPRAEAAAYFGGGAQHSGFRLALSVPRPPDAKGKKQRRPAGPAAQPTAALPSVPVSAPDASPASGPSEPSGEEEWRDDPSGALDGISTHLHLDPPRRVKLFSKPDASTASRFSQVGDIVFFGAAGRTRGRIGFVTEGGEKETAIVDLEEIGLFERSHGLVSDERGGPWGTYITVKPTDLWRMGPDGRAHVVATVPQGTALRLYGFANDAGTIVRITAPPRKDAPPAAVLLRFRDLH